MAELERTSPARRRSDENCFYKATKAKQNRAASLIRPTGPWSVTLGQALVGLGRRTHDMLRMETREPVCLPRPPGLTSLGISRMAVEREHGPWGQTGWRIVPTLPPVTV